MTNAPERPNLDFADIDDVAELVRRAGGRLTTPRRLVLAALFAADELLTAEQIATTGVTLDLTSVYRNLELLEELGIVRHIHVAHGPSVYGLARDGDREYLVCEACGKVQSVSPAELDGVRAV